MDAPMDAIKDNLKEVWDERLQYAKAAYEAYCKARNWKSVKGEPLPHFEQQSQELQDAWWEAANKVINLLHIECSRG